MIQRLRQRASEEGATLFMILLAAYNVLLHRYSGQEDLVVGVPIANRNRSEIEGLIGCFINTLAMRTDTSGNSTFRELLKRVRETSVDAYAHQKVPYERLINELKLRRDNSRILLFQTTFALQDFPEVKIEFDDVRCAGRILSTHTSKVDIGLTVERYKDGWASKFEYNSDLFSEDRIKRIHSHWTTLLESIVEDPGKKISELNLLSEEEGENSLIKWNDTARDYPLEGTIHELFELQVENSPDAIAVVCDEAKLTYRELNIRANQVAHHLRGLGIGPDNPVAICIDHSLEMLVGLLGILKAGGAYVPIDPRSPPQRLKLLIEDAEIKVIVTVSNNASLFTDDGVVLFLDQDGEWSRLSESNPKPVTDFRNLAYVLFTSGSTGRPKGVLVEHRQIRNYVYAFSEGCELEAGTYAMLQPLTVDSSQSVIFPAFHSGGTIHLIPFELSLNPLELADYFERHQIDNLKIAPAHLSALLTSNKTGCLLPKSRLLLGGERLPLSLLQEIKELRPSCRVWNHYGPTETTVGVLIQEIDLKGLNDSQLTVPLGRPLANVRAYILDTNNRHQPVGVAGEIFIGGEAVTRGYLSDEELTASAFLPDPFSEVETDRLYRTGDFGRRLPDGRIEFLGRFDSQVKIRGIRIELGEIESVLGEHPSIAQQVVVVRKDVLGQPMLAAYAVALNNSSITEKDLRGFLKERFPAAMVPSSIILMDELPRTRQGKINPKALPEPTYSSANKPSNLGKQIGTPTQNHLVKIWKDLLHRDEVDIYGDFFSMGGNSLVATLLIIRIREELKFQLSIRDLFNNPSIAELTEFIESSSVEYGQLENGSETSNSGSDPRSAGPTAQARSGTLKAGFSCFLVGVGRMPTEVFDVLREHGVHVCGISTTDKAIVDWAESQNLPCAGPDEDLKTFLESEPFDYLFSILNPRVLSSDVLQLPKEGAINFHDGPLPRFAGVNAPGWAIIQGETKYAVTWHQMTDKIDAGDILKQVPVEIAKSDTFLSLGLKCIAAGVSGFRDLIGELTSGTVTLTKQDLKQRTYFNRTMRPTPACIIDWSQSAEDIDAARRALDFGPLYNPIGLSKVRIEDQYYVVRAFSILDQSCSSSPGTLVDINEEGLTVATASKPIFIRELVSMDGAALAISECAAAHNLKVGDQLPLLDTAHIQGILRADRVAIRHESYWRERLGGLRQVSLVPYALPPKIVKAGNESQITLSIPANIESAFHSLGTSGTHRDYLLAAWGAFVGRMSGQDTYDIEFLSQESFSKWRDQLGLLSPCLPCRFELNSTTTINSLLADLQEKLTELSRHSVYGRDLILRDPVLFAKEELRSANKLPLGVWQVSSLNDEIPVAGYACLLLLPESQDEVGLRYDSNIISEESAARLMRYFGNFLEDLVAHTDRTLGCIRLLSTEEEEEVVKQCMGSDVNYPTDIPIHRLFEEKAESQPDSIAVFHEGHVVSYSELNTRANNLAHQLIEKGVVQDTLVGICLDRSINMVVGILGILKAGAAYLPLDPLYPKGRLEYMKEDAELSIIVTSQNAIDSLPSDGVQCLLLESLEAGSAINNTSNPEVEVSGKHLAYTIYTSGSTGKPKGVLVEHHSLVNYILSANRYYRVTSEDRILQFSSLSFDASAEEIYCALVSGATLVLRSEEMLSSPGQFVKCCEDWSISLLPLPTAYWHSWVAEMNTEDCFVPSTTRMVIIGGEAVKAQPLAHWKKEVGEKVRLINSYGPTETTIGASWYDLTDYKNDAQITGIPIGKPVDNLQAYVLDSKQNPLPKGVAGELCIGGKGLARGYLNQPALSTEKFIPNPFNKEGASRLYRTGDMVRLDVSGNLIYLGRIDDQVKIRGYRIELGEIEAAILSHPVVKECAVAVKKSDADDKRLAAYVVLANPKIDLPIQELKTMLQQKLPGFMVPSSFTSLVSLPRTLGGKIDRNALPDPVSHSSYTDQPLVNPRNSIDETLCFIWSDVLKLDEIGANDNFFELGGHSLLAMQLIARMREVLHVKV
ncbi:MAG: amino acid adenylation domain-containing protein, partial [Verrucomicrobia bacterium]|nr:amino acid adenylation domain-containing protein [Verrucomicrobiota bacterium]